MRIFLGFLSSLVLFIGATLHADTLTVTNSLDDVATPPPGSLRHTIASANAGDTIQFAPEVTGTITLAGAELLLDKNLTIEGPGATLLAISGNQQSRIFRIPTGKTITISALTVRDGKTTDGPDFTADVSGQGESAAGESGGGVLNEGTLTFTSCWLTNNATGRGGHRSGPGIAKAGDGGCGGAIMNKGDLFLVDCKLSGNQTGDGGGKSTSPDGGESGKGGDGGAIHSTGPVLDLRNCILQENLVGEGGLFSVNVQASSFPRAGRGGNGGSVSIVGGNVLIEDCSFMKNRGGLGGEAFSRGSGYVGSGGSGGAIYIGLANASLKNCTISDNAAGDAPGFLSPTQGGHGGGLACVNATTNLISCTIFKNIAGDNPGGPGPGGFDNPDGVGGGIYVSGGTTTVHNTIVAGNLPRQANFGRDVWGTLVSEGHNLIGSSQGSSGFTAGANGDLVGNELSLINPKLGVLADYGGPTPTHALLPGSPALDAGDDSILDTDQRGLPRLAGPHVDIGSVERQNMEDGPLVLTFAVAASAVAENAGNALITIVRGGNTSSGPVSVSYTTSNGSALAGSDYTMTSGTLTFEAGVTQRTIAVPISDDSAFEFDETFIITLSNPIGGVALANPNSLTVTIQNDDDGPGTLAFTAASSTVGETAQHALITVVRTNGANGTVSVSYATVSGSASSGSDYTSQNSTLTFGPGVTQQTIAIPILDDSIFETDESFGVQLSNPTGGAVLSTPNAHTVTIQSNDPPPPPPTLSFALDSSSIFESAGNLLIRVTRTGSSAESVSVSYQTSSGTAESGSDFASASGTLSFGASVAEQTIVVPIVQDELIEGSETFTVTLADPTNGAVLGTRSTHTVTILEDDGPSTVSFLNGSTTVDEAAGQISFTVVRSGNATLATTVQISANNGTATGGSDYSFQGSTITFPASATQQTATVSIFNDANEETDEGFSLVLSNPSGATLGNHATHTITILDDDDPAIISFMDASTTVDEASGQISITVVRSGNVPSAATVQVSANNGTAVGGSDYSFQSSTITFPAGVTQKTVTIPIINDANEETDETFSLVLSNPAGNATLGSQITHTITILDDAEDLPEIRKASYRGLAESVETDTPEFAGLSVKVTDRGRLTGTLQIRGKTLRLQGQFSDARTFSQSFTVRNQPSFTGGTLNLQPDEGGSILRGTFQCLDGTTFEVEARRELLGTRSNPVPETNAYTALLGTQLDGDPAGFLRARVAPSGGISLLAVLPDGTRLSASSHLADDRSFPIFIPTYAKKLGYLAGPGQFTEAVSLPLTGELHWKKTANSRPPYAAGFDDEAVELSGAVYTPQRRQRILDDFDTSQGLATLQLSGGQSATSPEIGLSWSERNALRPASPNPDKLQITLQASTGLWSGSFRDSSGQRHKLYGICLQQPEAGEDLALGFYLDGDLAGRVDLLPQE